MTTETMMWYGGAALVAFLVICYRSSLMIFMFRLLAPKDLKDWAWNIGTVKNNEERSKWIVEQVEQRLTTMLSEKLAERFEAERQNFYPKLRAQIATLRKERDDLKEGWIDIPVCVWGMRAREGDKNHYSGIVQYSLKEQRFRAHPSPAKRKLTPIRDNYGAIARESNRFPLGAPLYFKVEDTPTQVVMLGQTYTLD